MDARTTVYLLDDDEAVVRALARVLEAEGYRTSSYTSASEFLADHDPEVPGCLVTDLVMPDMSGLELQRALSDRGFTRPIVFVTARGDMPTTVEGMRAGAISFLAKPVRKSELLPTVREALAKDAATRSQQTEQHRVAELLERLTPREREVMQLVVQGLRNKQIADQLGTTEKTVKVHRGRLMGKMRVKSAAALATLLVRTDGTAQKKLRMPRED
jgi:RNA polymerase sigma factor (sigma-70 family)